MLMPKRSLCGAQLVLVTALEDRALVGAEGFAYALPLAATGAHAPTHLTTTLSCTRPDSLDSPL